jgi:multimeric flavodoxin WrbA
MEEELNLLGVAASPRADGNSFFLLERAIQAARDMGGVRIHVETFSFHGKRVGPCVQCYKCDKTRGECVIRDDFRELREKWLAADIVLYSVPVYHFAIPAQLKAFFDRLGQSASKRYPRTRKGEQALHLKIVGAIAQGLDIFSGQEHALMDLVQHAVLENCIPIAGDTYVGVGGWTMWSRETNRIESLAKQGDAIALFSVSAAESMGRRAVQLALILRAGARQFINLLEQEQAFLPLLERLKR